MGLFDKKYCDICGEKIGLLGNRKLDDGNLCKDCAKRLSPWFEERRHSTVEQIKEQLAYREANKERVRNFDITQQFDGSSYNIYIDENKKQFAVAKSMTEEANPDIIDLSQMTNCRLDIQEMRKEEQYRDKDGEMHDYFPPRYKYSYNYFIKINVDSPWFDEISVALNTWQIEEEERGKIRKMEDLGNDIISALKEAGRSDDRQRDNGTMQRGTVEPPLPSAEQTAASVNSGKWICTACGAENEGKFCEACGSPRPAAGAAGIPVCSKCGWKPADANSVPKFCPECGNKF